MNKQWDKAVARMASVLALNLLTEGEAVNITALEALFLAVMWDERHRKKGRRKLGKYGDMLDALLEAHEAKRAGRTFDEMSEEELLAGIEALRPEPPSAREALSELVDILLKSGMFFSILGAAGFYREGGKTRRWSMSDALVKAVTALHDDIPDDKARHIIEWAAHQGSLPEGSGSA